MSFCSIQSFTRHARTFLKVEICLLLMYVDGVCTRPLGQRQQNSAVLLFQAHGELSNPCSQDNADQMQVETV